VISTHVDSLEKDIVPKRTRPIGKDSERIDWIKYYKEFDKENYE